MADPTPGPMRPPTLRTIAAALGLSKSTVSYALQGNGQVAAATRARVIAYAQEVGFQPNLLMATAGRSRFHQAPSLVSMLVLCERRVTTTINAIIASSSAMGFRCTVEQLHGETALKARLRRARDSGVDAVLLAGALGIDHAALAAMPEWRDFAVLGIGRRPERPGYPFDVVEDDHFDAVLLAEQEVRRRGYERIGFVLFEHRPRLRDDDQRWAAAALLSQRESPDAPPPFVYSEEGKPPPPGLREWLHRHRPDAVIAFSALTYWWLRDLGMHTPRDIGFAGLHVSADSGNFENSSGILLSDTARAEMLLSILRDKLHLHQRGVPAQAIRRMVPPRWHEGITLRAAPKEDGGVSPPR